MTQQSWKSAIVVHQLIFSSSQQPSGLHQWNSGTDQPQNPNSQNYLSLLVTPEDTSTNNLAFTQKQPLTSNISPATITEDEKQLQHYYLVEPKAKPITTMYTDAKVKEQSIKLILDSGRQVDQAASARIITADGVIKTPIGEINDFSFEVNSIMTSIKVLVMEATQYQALVGNDWLFKVNLTYQGQHIYVPAMCGHFKTPPREKLLIELEEEKEKPTWEAYQMSWADKEHNKLPPIFFWDDSNKRKGKQKEELTWEIDDLTWTDNNKTENGKRTKKIKEKGKKKRPLKPPLLITPLLYYNNLSIVNLSLYASIVARNCCQWAHAVRTMRNIQWQLGSIAVHVSLNALEDQNE
ncbi:hypothetical protein G9A89_022752 [Geosiphon pyriformis]|nr:hypothetical protein G9A89_022752 [Geosiphon pyriformis]